MEVYGNGRDSCLWFRAGGLNKCQRLWVRISDGGLGLVMEGNGKGRDQC